MKEENHRLHLIAKTHQKYNQELQQVIADM